MYEEYKGINKDMRSNKSLNEETYDWITGAYNEFRKEIQILIPNEKMLVNTIIDLSYNKSKITKVFAWAITGDLILKCMLSKTDNTISFPTRDITGDIEFDGEIFKMVESIIEEEDE